MESILKKHRGYVGELKTGGAAGSGRTLNATLRVPADQLDASLTELKTLGRVESESQSGQDVTSQYVDLQARLGNARNTEQRLTDLLRQRTGKLSDVLEVEQEVDSCHRPPRLVSATRPWKDTRVWWMASSAWRFSCLRMAQLCSSGVRSCSFLRGWSGRECGGASRSSKTLFLLANEGSHPVRSCAA